MKKPSPLKLWLYTSLILLFILSLYPANIWWEWKQEQDVFARYGGEIVRKIPEKHQWLKQKTPESVHRYLKRCVIYSHSEDGITWEGMETRPRTSLTSKGLKDFRAFTELDRLFISGATVDPNVVVQIANATKLTTLELSNAGLRNADIETLASVPGIRSLDLSNNPITDKGLRHLSTHPTLVWIRLDNTRITDAGLRHLASIANLERALLNGTTITDNGLQAFANHPTLKGLGLMNTTIGDSGLKHLSSVTNLQGLGLTDTQTTDHGLTILFSESVNPAGFWLFSGPDQFSPAALSALRAEGVRAYQPHSSSP